jgi:hypothetical protein
MPYKLGKKPKRWSPKTLLLDKYTQDADGNQLPPAEKIYLEYKIPPATIGMYGNDVLSCCLAAYAAHHLMVITAHVGTPFVPDPADVIKFYSAFSGYVPGDPSTDNGGYFTDMYNEWQTNGLCGYKIDGWAQIDTKDYVKRQQAIRLFLGCGVGVQLPTSAQTQFAAGQNWELIPNDTIEGGHALLEPGEGSEGHDFESWGKGDQKASNAWDLAYTDEVYVPLTKLVISAANDIAPKSLNYDALVADLALIKS